MNARERRDYRRARCTKCGRCVGVFLDLGLPSAETSGCGRVECDGALRLTTDVEETVYLVAGWQAVDEMPL